MHRSVRKARMYGWMRQCNAAAEEVLMAAFGKANEQSSTGLRVPRPSYPPTPRSHTPPPSTRSLTPAPIPNRIAPAPELLSPAPAPAIAPTAPMAPVAQVAPSPAPRQAEAFGIRRAMELLRRLPAGERGPLLEVVKMTLEAVSVHVSSIVSDASNREGEIDRRIAVLRGEAKQHEEAASVRRNEITQLET